MITDQGSEFRGEFSTLLAAQQITHRTSFREHPQSDGLSERMVQTLKKSLRKCLLERGSEEWDELLPYVAMGYRLSKQKSLGYSPYYLIFGRHPIFQASIQDLEE